jgi:membrane protease YdiL (CAAX protease family)
MARLRAIAGDVWTARVAVWPLCSIVVTIVLGIVAAALWRPTGTARVTLGIAEIVLFYGAAVTVIFVVGSPIAARVGGWSAAFGWGRPSLRDVGVGIVWAIGEFVARVIVTIVLIIGIPPLRGANASNVHLHGRPLITIVIAGVLAVVVAPPIEELIFRGLILRTLMLRTGFWPAAVASSGVFALLHVYEASSAPGAVLLFVGIGVFGVGQCLLVRWRARLAPAIVAHAATNAIGLALSVAIAT